MYISIEKAIKKGKGKVSLRGWVYRERGSSKIKFVVLRDSSNIIQCVIEKDKISEKEWQDAEKLLVESSIELQGEIKKDERAPTGYEINVSKLNVVHFAEKYPITKDQSEEFLLDVRHLAIRSRRLTASLKIRSTVLGALHECLRKKGYTEAEAPSFNAATSEGGAEVFKLDYFGRKVFLTQSWQFYAENFIYAFEKVYAMAPSFRAEKSRTNRHLTEFWHCEVEAAWENMDYIIKVAEDCIMNSIKEVLKNNKVELKVLEVPEDHLKNVKIPFPRITYKDAVELLNKKNFPIKYGDDFGVNEEREIAAHYNSFVVVTNFPLEILKFYHGEDPKNPGTGTNFNLMAPGIGETVDGSQRESDLNKIVERLKKADIDLGDSNWYLDSRRYGAVPHSGFGLGTERLVQWICKLETIKDAIPFPRTPTRVYP